MFLALADLSDRRANLEHAAASLPNLLQTMILVSLVAMVLLAKAGPDLAPPGVHPVSLCLPVVYAFGLVLSRRSRDAPMWRPLRTVETRPDVPAAEAERASRPGIWLRFVVLAAVVAGCGFAVTGVGLAISARTELSGTLVAGLLTSVASCSTRAVSPRWPGSP